LSECETQCIANNCISKRNLEALLRLLDDDTADRAGFRALELERPYFLGGETDLVRRTDSLAVDGAGFEERVCLTNARECELLL